MATTQIEIEKLEKLKDVHRAATAAVEVMGKTGYLMQANLDENPYVWIGALEIDQSRNRDYKLMFALRQLVLETAEDPKEWKLRQFKLALKNCQKCIADLEAEKKMYEKFTIGKDSRYAGWNRNLWALAPLKVLEEKIKAELETLEHP